MSEGTRVSDNFLENLKRDGIPTIVFLINGVKLQGVVDDFDSVSIVLRREQNVQLLFREAISTVVPQNVAEN